MGWANASLQDHHQGDFRSIAGRARYTWGCGEGYQRSRAVCALHKL